MKCHRIRQNIVLDLYGELKTNEKDGLEKHIAECSACASDYAYSKKVFEALEEAEKEEIPEPQWDTSWAKINTSIQNKPQRQRAFLVFPKWAYAAAGVLCIFLLGIFAGRFWFPAAQETVQAADTFQDDFQQTLKIHFEELKPVLLQMANYTAEENGEGTVMLDRKIIQSLIIQNILLKSLIVGQNPTAEQILEDVELVLRELANMEEGDSRTKSMVKELIDEREILLNMNILQKM
jgi:hypothetical protein